MPGIEGAPQPDVIEQGGGRRGDRIDRNPRLSLRRLAPTSTRQRVSLLLAFAVGVAAGLVAWRQWDEAADTRVARSTVALVAWTAYGTVNQGGGGTVIESYLRLHNAGPYPVEVSRLEIVQPGLTPKDALPNELTVDAGETAVASIRSDLRCEDFDQRGAPALLVRARPAAGADADHRIVLTDSGDLVGLVSGTCAPSESTQLEMGVSYVGAPTVSGTGRGARLRAIFSVGAWGPAVAQESVLNGVASSTDAFVVDADRLPVSVRNGETATITLTWRVADCATAADLNAGGFSHLRLTGRRGEAPEEISGDSDVGPEMLLALVRFVDSACS